METLPVEPDLGDLQLRTALRPGGCTVTVAGDVDSRGAPRLADCLRDALGRSDVSQVDLDLREVTFLGAAGLTALVGAHRTAHDAGQVLRIRCGTRRAVLRPLELTGLTTVLTLVEA
jgi:anti-sigma B factor antagonist